MSNFKKERKATHPKRKQSAAEKRARRERREKFMTISMNGKKRVPRPPLINGLPVEEFIARNADPIWLHEHGLWELITPEDVT